MTRRITKKKPFLGPLHLAWCDECNLPIAIGDRCDRCDKSTRKVRLAPPGDVRPAFKGDLKRLRVTLTTQYGEAVAKNLIPANKIVLLNAIPDLDRCEEVILDGQIIGLHRFRIDREAWEFVPKLEGGRRLASLTEKNRVVIDNSAVAYIVRGANIMGPGIKDADPGIKPGDFVFAVDEQGSVVLTGLARITGKEMQSRPRGEAVRKRYFGPPKKAHNLPGGQTWDDVLVANTTALQQLEKKATRFIRSVIAKHNRPVVVAYSGGKDSLAVLLLVQKSCPELDFKVIFIDTGIEFPETVENVITTMSSFGLSDRLLVKHVPKDQFFHVLDQYGLVARDYRVCCKTVKLGPTAQLIEEHFPQGCLSFIGQRRYESQRRAQSGRLWHNPWVPNQIGASPIHDWTALMVWLYLFREQAPFNELYQRGFERIGCMFCPASTMSEFSIISAQYTNEWNRWFQTAQGIAKQQGLSEKWVKYGFWRWRNHPPKIRDLAHQLNVPLKTSHGETRTKKLTYEILHHRKPSPTKASIQGKFNHPLPLDQVMAFLPALGEVKQDKQRDFIQIAIGKGNNHIECQVFGSGDFITTGPAEAIQKTADLLVKAIFRGILCTGCGTCQALCAHNAIDYQHHRARINTAACTQCRACLNGKCPTLYAL